VEQETKMQNTKMTSTFQSREQASRKRCQKMYSSSALGRGGHFSSPCPVILGEPNTKEVVFKRAVDKALAELAEDERKEKLLATDGASLLKLCKRTGVDPFVKEVMIDRVIRKENAAGRYLRPMLDKEEPSTCKKLDMVDALLANEAKRKKTKAQATGMEEKIASNRKELKSWSVDDLKAALEEKGMEPCSKKRRDD